MGGLVKHGQESSCTDGAEMQEVDTFFTYSGYGQIDAFLELV